MSASVKKELWAGLEVVSVRTSASARTSATARRRSGRRSTLLGAHPEVDVVAVSTLRETEPVGYRSTSRRS